METQIETIILDARAQKASDIHITEGMKLMYRIHGRLKEAPCQFDGAQTRRMILEMLNEKQLKMLESGKDLDFAVQTSDGGRQRVNVFRQQKGIAATIRLLSDHIPALEELKLPDTLQKLAAESRGLILVTGPTGSGKSTTLAAMINEINTKKREHIITIEDPVEYKYESDQSLIHQREVGEDVADFASALRSALREDPDIILVGEMRDYETISAALTAAETGQLVLSTLHTTGAAQTVDRIIDVCPEGCQDQVRTQLAGVLKGIVTQCLVPLREGEGRIAATEILVGTDAVCSLIRENKTFQVSSAMQAGRLDGMHTLNMDLVRLEKAGSITMKAAMQYTNDRRDLEQYYQ